MSKTKKRRNDNGGLDGDHVPAAPSVPTMPNMGIERGKLELHKSFLQNLKKDEDARLATIEQKTSQPFSQTGIIVAVLALFIPLIIDKVDPVWARLLFITLLCSAGFFYLRTIYCAGKNLDIDKFKYQRSAASTLRDPKLKTTELFLAEEISDLLKLLPANEAQRSAETVACQRSSQQ